MDTNKFKKQLETELKLVVAEMKEVGRVNPSNPKNWEAVETDLNADMADDDEVADEMENFNENESILGRLEPKYNDIIAALEKIKKGIYGKCEIGGEDISLERLEANPAAKTCIKHSKSKK